MAWYKTDTLSIAANSKKATGHGPRWADNKQGIGPGQMLLLPGTGTVALYKIASVVSDTELLLESRPSKAVNEASCAIVTYNGGSYVDFGRELSAQIRYYQRQMDGWQQIITGEGEVKLEAPDGTQVTLSSFKKLTADITGKVDKSALDDKAELEDKADNSELDKKVDKAELETKADKSALRNYIAKTGGSLTGTLHFDDTTGQGGSEQRSAASRYNPYAEGNSTTEFYCVDVRCRHYEHRLLINRGGGNIKWFIFKDDGNAYAQQGHWQNNSDSRIKSDIEKIENGLAKIETLNGYTYVLAKNRQAGVMAYELEKVLPEAVSNSGDYHENDGTIIKNVKAIAYGSISALLIEAIKDLSAKVKTQQAEIDALKASMSTVYVAQDADSAK